MSQIICIACQNKHDSDYFILQKKCLIAGLITAERTVSSVAMRSRCSLYGEEYDNKYVIRIWRHCGPGSVVSIANGYVLDGPGIESRWGEIFRTCPDRPWGPPSFLYNGYRVFPGGKSGRGVTLPLTPF